MEVVHLKTHPVEMRNAEEHSSGLCAKEVGGYFELELPDFSELYPAALKFQSARAAFRALLQGGTCTHVLMPAYTCDSMIRAADEAVFFIVSPRDTTKLRMQKAPK